MEFITTITCRKCGREYSTLKRYNDFMGQWEMDSDVCEECSHGQAKRVEMISPISP